MNNRDRYKETQGMTLSLPWNKTTAKAWFISVLITGLFLFLLTFIKLDPPTAKDPTEGMTLVMLELGDITKDGKAGGNATKEGKKSSGNKATNNLEDAKEQAQDSKVDKTPNVELGQSENLVPENEPTVEKQSPSKKTGSDEKSIGSKEGSDDLLSRGLGKIGTGRGKGYGLGDIDWGGGGNRMLQNKVIPKFPKNVNASSKIILQINVMPNGDVTKIVPVRTGDPRLESAAIAAIKKWKFNPIDSNVVMVGEIPINFRVR